MNNSYELNINKTNHKSLVAKFESGVDTHIHTSSSFDGGLSFEEIMNEIKDRKLDYLAITDHNNIDVPAKLFRQAEAKSNQLFVQIGNTKIVTGTEVTCYCKVSNNKFMKLHMLCYGFDPSRETRFAQIVRAKNYDAWRSSIHPFVHLANKRSIFRVDNRQIVSYMKYLKLNSASYEGYISKANVIDYFEHVRKIEPEVTSAYLLDYKDRQEEIKLDVQDVIDTVHEAGGYCIMAHPIKSMQKFLPKISEPNKRDFFTKVTNDLLSKGMDGVEFARGNSNDTRWFNKKYSKVFLTSTGTDTHDLQEKQFKTIGKYFYSMPTPSFGKVMNELAKARSENKQTPRQAFNEYHRLKRIEKEKTSKKQIEQEIKDMPLDPNPELISPTSINSKKLFSYADVLEYIGEIEKKIENKKIYPLLQL